MNYDWMKVFEKCHGQIYNDYLSVKNAVQPWPEEHLYDDGWEAYGIIVDPNMEAYISRKYGNAGKEHMLEKRVAKSNECVFTRKLIKEHVPNHGTAGFSILKPGTHIKPHMGIQGKFLRMHLGVDVPEGDLGLKSVTHGTQVWENGKAFWFDDRLMHEAWNKTNEIRVILIVDFEEVK